jgi:hypothetical protein
MVDVYHIPTLKGDRTHQTLIIERAQNFGSDFVEEAFHKVIMDYGTRLLYEQNKPRSSETAELFAALDSLDRRVRVNIRSILAKRRILMADPVVAPKVIPKTLRRRLKTVNQRCLRALPGTVRRR